MRRVILLALPFLGSLAFAASEAQAVVVDLNPSDQGHPSVQYPNSSNSYYGVALVPTARQGTNTTASYLSGAGIPIVTSSAPCSDPAAGTEPDILSAGSWPLSASAQPICWHGGPVMHANETFTLEWEGQSPNTYWSDTKSYLQTYLSDVAAASGSLGSPYADTTQYWDGTSVQDRAANASVFGGGCDDNGTAKCKFGSTTGSGTGNQLPSSSDCVNPVSGNNILGGSSGGGAITIPNNLCLTNADIQHEVTSLVDIDGLIKYIQPGHTPLVTVLTPPGVVVCLNAVLCSANGRITPPPTTVTTANTGGLIPAGTYEVVATYYDATNGETLPSAPVSVTTTGSTSTITISSPPAQAGYTSWYAYVTQSDGSTFTRQGSVLPLGTDDTLATSPSSTGPTPPTTPASFCSYHAQMVDPQSNQTVSYIVQPWTAFTSCDEPDVPPPPMPGANFDPAALEKVAGQALVSPLSQAEMGAIVNPQFNGWFGLDGLEINDQNSCQPLSSGLDTFTIGANSYFVQRESNNTTVVDSDPFTYGGCLPADVLAPAFVVPSAIDLGDTLDLDGSATATSLGIPNANFSWDFGDGPSGQPSTGTGPSVEHTYAKGGTYTVKLTVTDRGGNQATLSQAVQVLGATGLPVTSTPTPSTTSTTSTSTGGAPTPAALTVRLLLLPQSLRSALRNGIALKVNSSEPANGFATVSISRRAAKRAHIKTGKKPFVVIGTGTLSNIKSGTVTLHLRMSRAMAKKLSHLKHVTLTVRLALVDSAGKHVAVDVAGNY